MSEILQEPFFKQPPEELYVFESISDIRVELGEAIDPQGGVVNVSVELGETAALLQYKNGVISSKDGIPTAILNQ